MKKATLATFVLGSVLWIQSATASSPVEIKSSFKTDFTSIGYANNGNQGYVSKSSANQNLLNGYGHLIPHSSQDKLALDDQQYPTNSGYRKQCVSFVKAVSNAGATSSWRTGTQVSANSLPSKWSIIATFTEAKVNGEPRYGNNNTSHVAVFIGKSNDNKGIWVIDQNWDKKGWMMYHYIPFTGTNQNGANNYYVVKQ